MEHIVIVGIITATVGAALALSVPATVCICCYFLWKRSSKKNRKKKFQRWDKKIRPQPPTKRPKRMRY